MFSFKSELPSATIEVSVNTTMEDNQKTSEYLYEDEHVFLTQDNTLYLKEDFSDKERKLCEVSEEDVEEKVAELNAAFEDLKGKVEQTLSEEDVNSETLKKLEEEIENTSAIGNMGKLLDQIEQHKSSEKEEETETKEVSKPAANEQQQAEEPVEDQQEDENPDETEDGTVSEEDDDSIEYYQEIVEKAEDLAQQSDWSYVSVELDNLSHRWSEGPDTDSKKVKKLFQKFNKAVDAFENRKQEHYEQLEKEKQENLEIKEKLLEELEGIISNETWTATKRVSQMKRQWNNSNPLPSGKSEKLEERFQELLEVFNEHKVDRLVQKRQKEEDNLMLKLAVLEKMEKVANSITHETTRWEEIDERFEDLTNQWKKIGRVPKEKSDHVWERYKDAQDTYYDNKYKHDPEHQSKVDKFYHKKEKLCEEAESLLEEEDIATAARKINKLHRRWKKVGNLPQRTEDKLWNRFKSATDALNEKKANNQDKIKEQEEEHYQQKLELIEKAKEVKDTDDFEKGHSKMQSFMDRWKKIGPAPRDKSNEIWKKFKGAMDEFYDRRREHFKKVKEERKENLKKKKEILEKLRELGQHDDPIEAVDIAKDLQEKFKNVGYVPIKHKNKMWKQYREACDVIYDRMRAAKSGDKFDQELAKADLGPEARNKIQNLRNEYKKIKKEVRALEKEALQYKEKKTYFKPSNGGNSLLDQVQEKIDQVEEKIDQKQEKMDELTDEMDDIRERSKD